MDASLPAEVTSVVGPERREQMFAKTLDEIARQLDDADTTAFFNKWRRAFAPPGTDKEEVNLDQYLGSTTFVERRALLGPLLEEKIRVALRAAKVSIEW